MRELLARKTVELNEFARFVSQEQRQEKGLRLVSPFDWVRQASLLVRLDHLAGHLHTDMCELALGNHKDRTKQ